MWNKIKNYLKGIGWIAKVLGWIKVIPVPTVQVISGVTSAIVIVIEKVKEAIIKANQKKSDEIVKKEQEINTEIIKEKEKPQSQQNNDVLREQARRRHNGN